MKVFLATGLILLVLVALVQWRAHSREAAAEAAYPPTGRLIDVDGVQVHAEVMGEGPDLVLIHGASGNTRDFTLGFAQALATRYRVILFDRPGLGWTDRAGPRFGGAWNTAAEGPGVQAALLAEAAASLGVDRPVVLGHSFGGAVALAWALDHQAGAVVMVAGVANPWPGDLGRLYHINSSAWGGALFVPLLTAFAPRKLIDDTISSIFAPDAPPAGYLDHVGPGLTLRRGSMRANARQVNFLRPHIVEMSARYGEIRVPVEVVHGDADTIVPLRIHSASLPDQIDGARLTVLQGVGHMPHHTDPEAVIAAIDRAADRAGLR